MKEKTPEFDWRGKGFSFFSNTKCEFFPCHKIKSEDKEQFNCLFCYCPLYEYDDCGGAFKYLDNGCKDCSACTLPHRRDNYGMIIEKLGQKRK